LGILKLTLPLFIASSLTQIIHEQFQLPIYFCSALIGLAGGIIFYKNDNIAAAIFCGSFIGMIDAPLHLGKLFFMSIISASVFFLLRNKFLGLGGKLGATAFIGVLIGKLLEKI
jgi:hypothetical protein